MEDSEESNSQAGSPDTLAGYAKRAREATGMSMRQAAPLIGCHHSVLARIESGDTTRPSPELLQSMAEVYEIDAEPLLAFIGVKPVLPTPKVYFRRAFGMSESEASEAEQLIAELRARKHSETDQS